MTTKETMIDVMPPPSAPGQKGGDSDDLIYELVPLPSKGKLYAPDHPFSNLEAVEVKAPTAEEEDVLSTPGLIKQGTVLNVLLRRCVTTKLLDPQSLLVGDKTALLLALRVLMFTADYKVRTSCPECGKQFDHTFDLSKVKIQTLGAEPVEKNKNLFSFTLPTTKKKVLFSLLTDQDDADVAKMQENRKKAGIQSEVESNVSERLIRQVKSFDGETDQSKIAGRVRHMRAIDSRALRNYISRIQPDAILEQSVKCRYCAAEEKHDIPMSLEFFWPDRD